MTLEKATEVSFEQMKGTVGSLLFLWSQIERELTESIHDLTVECKQKHPHGIARSLDFWFNEIHQKADRLTLATDLCDDLAPLLKEALDVRNSVCHGLIGIAADLSSSHEEACITVEMGEHTRELKWAELQTMFEWMSQARWLIRDLTTAVLDTHQLRSEELLLKWKGFPHQR